MFKILKSFKQKHDKAIKEKMNVILKPKKDVLSTIKEKDTPIKNTR